MGVFTDRDFMDNDTVQAREVQLAQHFRSRSRGKNCFLSYSLIDFERRGGADVPSSNRLRIFPAVECHRLGIGDALAAEDIQGAADGGVESAFAQLF